MEDDAHVSGSNDSENGSEDNKFTSRQTFYLKPKSYICWKNGLVRETRDAILHNMSVLKFYFFILLIIFS